MTLQRIQEVAGLTGQALELSRAESAPLQEPGAEDAIALSGRGVVEVVGLADLAASGCAHVASCEL